jgi:hypothetical protein
MTATLTRPGLAGRIGALDLTMVKTKLQDSEEGSGWSAVFCERVDVEYRRYLFLTGTYPELPIVPSKIVDTFWHGHILDTQAYAPDCQIVFGYFLHHYPYFGMRGPDDAAALGDAYDHTLELYEKHFAMPPADLWARSGAARCPNCGNRCK